MNVRQQLEREEGRRHNAYLCSEGVPTIGVGHTGPEVHIGLVWTDEQIEAALASDAAKATAAARAVCAGWFDRLNEPRQAVLIGMAFQLGQRGLSQFVRTLGAIRDERYELAKTYMLDSLWAKQTPARARRMADQMATGEWC